METVWFRKPCRDLRIVVLSVAYWVVSDTAEWYWCDCCGSLPHGLNHEATSELKTCFCLYIL